jgi:hypothetical protein
MNLLRSHFPPLGFLAALLAALVAAWGVLPAQSAVTDLSISPDTPLVTGPDLKGLPAASKEEVVARIADLSEQPLFAEGRRLPSAPTEEMIEEQAPAEPVIEEPVPESIQPPEIRLVGILKRPGEIRALVRSEGSGTEDWVGTGDVVQEWTVVAISQNEMTLAHSGTEIAVQLYQE